MNEDVLSYRRLREARMALVNGMLDRSMLRLAFALKDWNPDQPRVPAGNPDGGQWLRQETGGSTTRQDRTAANDGTPGSNSAQNAQIDDIVRLLKLNKDERRQLHDEISGQNLGFREILDIAKDIKGGR